MIKLKILLLSLVYLSLQGQLTAQGNKAFAQKLSDAAISITSDKVIYDPAYFSIPYPNGDIPANRGVCTDVVIRAYRKLGVDLQKQVHEDMRINFEKYPKNWGLKKTDRNIDHRRVPNLMTFFSRKGISKSIKKEAEYVPGDIVTWNLPNGASHIGIVVDKKNWNSKRYKIVHNIGSGQVIEDCLYNFKITGHYTFE
ncbi:hypothetical protein AwDysgo_13140 [Bacteroidales bacterium]|nr:hypothetical protein AwDysgo_13140 [Bacteroidales bacterium]